MSVRRCLALIMLAGSVISCGQTQAAAPVAQTSEDPGVLKTAAAGEGPAVDWDAPIPQGVYVRVAEARRVGALPFEPIAPAFSVQPRVQVTNPDEVAEDDRAVTYIFKFPVGADFPTDGRLVVTEGPTDQTSETLRQIALSHNGKADDGYYDEIVIQDQPALLIHSDTVGRVRFIRTGIYFDITGPAATTAAVTKLATLLAAQIG